MKKITLFIAALFLGGIMYAQNNVSGVIVDGELGTSLPGASIVVKGTNNGVSSDFNGQFSLDLAKGSHKIMISYVGYETKLIDVEIDKNMTTYITLSEELSELEVMVVSASKFEQKLER